MAALLSDISSSDAGNEGGDGDGCARLELRERSRPVNSNKNKDDLYQMPSSSSASALGHNNNALSTSNGKVMVEHQVKTGETINSIALQYSCSVADIKRANNLTTEQDIYALPRVKLPITRLQKALLDKNADVGGKNVSESHAASTASILSPSQYATDRSYTHARHKRGNKEGTIPLLDDYDEHYVSDDSLEETRQKMTGILARTDANCASVRQQLPSPSLPGGAFHFVDASAPVDNTARGICLLIAAVVFIFMVVPLLLTFLEESNERLEHASPAGGHSHAA